MNEDVEVLLVNIGRKIKELRQERGITQQYLAELCDFENSNMNRIEAGRSNLTIKTLLIVAKSLGVSVRDLIPY